ncbi:ABC transporter permease [Actinorugispora endophytica]|uniref:Putative ABC transport system permease protein n=1 Tax=Actinorugispora endophytica TaxID=1605990 RepID=A0A4R6UJU0_9ACTN|nr:FtsX-like permease family protein [Actinorugispora endophytica]TDQ47208.1 putative ABC transport system permease protein [Actinorugispora endophytica]
MGHLLLVWRLVLRDTRRRPGDAVVFLLAVTVATACLSLGLAADNAVAAGYARTHEATAGPDLTAITTAADSSDLVERIADMPGVAARADPVFAFSTVVQANGRTARSSVEGRESAPSAVDRPLVTSGTWVRPGGAVVERGFAQALGVGVGDRVTVSGRGYPVVGIAVSAATPVYPWSDWAQGPGTTDRGGRIWFTTADARAAAGDASGVHLVHLKLTSPDAVIQWRDTVFTPGLRGDAWVNTRDWQTVLRMNTNMIRGSRPALVVGGWLLAAAAIVTLAALAAVRASRDNRRAGLLKAVGAGPGTVAVVLLAQHLLLTALAAALGLAVGALVAPGLVDPSAGLLDTAGPPSAGVVAAAVLVAVLVAMAGTLGPALRAARTSTVHALAEPARLLTRRPWLTAVTAYLPTSLLIGVRLLARRPGHAVLTAVSVAATSVMVTALLSFRTALATVATAPALEAVDARTGQVLLGVTLVTVMLCALNTVFLGWSCAVRARRVLAVTRVLGATPGQVVAALCAAQLLPAVPGLLAGSFVGIVLYWFFNPGNAVTPPGSWLVAAALAVLAAVAALTALPAWVHSRSPAGRALDTGPV